MAKLIGVVSQKGGVGKSTITRLVGVEYAFLKQKVLIADMDNSQKTCYQWYNRRKDAGIEPLISVDTFDDVDQVLSMQEEYDIIVFDGAPHATRTTHKIVEVSQLTLLPTCSSLEDLNPQITLAHELVSNGIDKNKLVFVLSKINSTKSELEDAIEYILASGYNVLDHHIPERTAFRQAITDGKIITETKFNSLNKKCKEMFNSINSKMKELVT